MNKNELIYEVANDTRLSARAVELVLNSTLNIISGSLAEGNPVVLSGFGTFSPQFRAARTGRNPHTKKAVPIPACVKPKFKAGKDLLAAVSKLETVFYPKECKK